MSIRLKNVNIVPRLLWAHTGNQARCNSLLQSVEAKQRQYVRFDNLGVQNELDFWVLARTFLHHARSPKLSSAVDYVYL